MKQPRKINPVAMVSMKPCYIYVVGSVAFKTESEMSDTFYRDHKLLQERRLNTSFWLSRSGSEYEYVLITKP